MMNNIHLIPLTALFAFTIGLPKSGESAPTQKPNLLIIYADDLGWADISAHGGSTPTPNIDRIFSNGIEFTNYTTHAVCSPSRATLMTGRHYLRMNSGPLVNGNLPHEEITIAETFQAAGYVTGCFGKWHNSLAPGGDGFENHKHLDLGKGVNAYGFDRFVGYYGGGPNYFTHYSPWYREKAWYHDGTLRSDEEGYTTDLITKYAIEFIQEHKKGPFFCYVPEQAPHNPLQAKYEDILRVPEAVRKGTKLLSAHEYASFFEDYTGWQKMSQAQQRIVYSAMLLALDDSVGSILNTLESEGILDDTIIFFASDNGATPTGNNLPHRGTKHTLFEGGIHVPAALWWKKGGFTGGRRFDQDFSYLDVYPTLTTIADIDRLPGPPLDGRNAAKQIRKNKTLPERQQHWMWREEGALRQGDWKYIYHPFNRQLYKLDEDIGESKNLVDDYPEKAESMKQAHIDWLHSNHYNPSYIAPKVEEEIEAKPDGDVLEIHAKQTKPIKNRERGQIIIFALGAGRDGMPDTTPGDVIEYDICVAEDSLESGFFYTPSEGWIPKFNKSTGFDQYGRFQGDGPAPKGGKGVWEHRVIGIGNIAPLRMPFNMVCLASKQAGTHHFYLDNVVLKKSDGRVIKMWTKGSDTFHGWDKNLLPPKHTVIRDIQLNTIPLEKI